LHPALAEYPSANGENYLLRFSLRTTSAPLAMLLAVELFWKGEEGRKGVHEDRLFFK